MKIRFRFFTMTTLFSVCLFGMVFFAPHVQAEVINTVTDGTMEANILPPWIRYGQPNLLEKNSDIFFEGTKSIHVISSNVNGRGGFQQSNIPVQAGQTYTVKFRYYLKQGSLRTWFAIVNPNGAFDGRVDTLAGNENQWQLFERQVTVPNNFVQDFRFMLNTQDAEAYIDNVEIYIPEPEPQPEEPEDPPANPNAELADADMEALNTDSWQNYKEPSLKEKSIENQSGSQSLHFVTPRVEGRIQNSSGVQQTNLSAQAGKTYTLSFWYKNSGDLLPRIGIQNSDEDFELALEAGIAPILSPTNEWTYYERTFTLPENFLTDLRLVFVVYDVQSSADWNEVTPLAQGEAFIDDVNISLTQQEDPPQDENPQEQQIPHTSPSPVLGSPVLIPPPNVKTFPYPYSPFLSVVEINNGATTTASSTITLTFNIQNVKYMAISNTSRFEEYDVVPFASTTSWTLTEGNGDKTIHILFKSETGGTIHLFEKITLKIPEPEGVGGFPFDPREQAPCELSTEKIYKVSDSEGLYVVTAFCTKQKISPELFQSYASEQPVAFLIPEKDILNIPDEKILIFPFGKNYIPQTGDLLQSTHDTKIYLILKEKKYWIRSEEIFIDLGFSFEKVKVVVPYVLDQLETGEILG